MDGLVASLFVNLYSDNTFAKTDRCNQNITRVHERVQDRVCLWREVNTLLEQTKPIEFRNRSPGHYSRNCNVVPR